MLDCSETLPSNLNAVTAQYCRRLIAEEFGTFHRLQIKVMSDCAGLTEQADVGGAPSGNPEAL